MILNTRERAARPATGGGAPLDFPKFVTVVPPGNLSDSGALTLPPFLGEAYPTCGAGSCKEYG